MATAMHAMQGRVDVAAGNLANASTDGFRRHVAELRLRHGGVSLASHVASERGALRHTGRTLDVAVTGGSGGFLVRDAAGRVAVIGSASFQRTAKGEWLDPNGRVLLAERGTLRAPADATVDERGTVTDPSGGVVGRIRVQGDATVQSGFIEASNVDAVHEMVDILAAQRAFETAQKTMSAIDDVRAKAAGDVPRLRS
ncbi:MAG: hypothetical protein JO043_11955 [Candidatus Eremiobacteraeota bacterium]|nr:hypothetical protein [Candidatus Eremiobacteraeota bacterium]